MVRESRGLRFQKPFLQPEQGAEIMREPRPTIKLNRTSHIIPNITVVIQVKNPVMKFNNN